MKEKLQKIQNAMACCTCTPPRCAECGYDDSRCVFKLMEETLELLAECQKQFVELEYRYNTQKQAHVEQQKLFLELHQDMEKLWMCRSCSEAECYPNCPNHEIMNRVNGQWWWRGIV